MSRLDKGFSLIEILLVLALMGMMASICVVHFDALQDLFAGDSRSLSILNKAIQEGRLWCAQNHKPARLVYQDNALMLKSEDTKAIQTFPFSKAKADHLRLQFFPGKLDANGNLRPELSANSTDEIYIDASGFFQSVFIEIALDEDKEKYALDILTGALDPSNW